LTRGFVVTGGDGAVLLELLEEVFDQMAGFIKFLVGILGKMLKNPLPDAAPNG
jgi:hypothetical protein